MRYRCLLLATLCLSFDRPCVFADVIASAGFNDAVGLNSNPQANSPYTLNATIQGKGLPEPGWSRPWQDNFPPQQSVVQSSFVFEGDGALALLPTALPSRAWNEQQFGIFSVKQRVMLTLGARLVAYTEVEATGEAISNQAAIWQAFPDQSIRVIDGTENSCDVCGDEITSFVWEPFTNPVTKYRTILLYLSSYGYEETRWSFVEFGCSGVASAAGGGGCARAWDV